MEIAFAPQFLKQYHKLEPALREEVAEKVELFADANNHQQLKVHKLKGRLKNRYSFSVNYQTRIVFVYESKQSAILLAVGDHSVYDR
ncbi:type II toxin-antitoxin system RelE/ParE family toxin [Candidatus Kaiserbacteria bacterium]|nr:type II toxin-antitoxin system RelE/ParE family toxin [Candidatus Kaiserbacteria bacterium]MCB9812636.1 type II toxin-antitoxin system RelE/ParE family toxin [Candidatus Nomurabacteria bacterium]